LGEDDILITADTVVLADDKVLAKPGKREEALESLRLLSGRSHKVITGVVITTLKRQVSFLSETNVTFCELEESEILYYVDRYQPYDKAGSYGIQEWVGYVGTERIEGSYFNVMGLPVNRLYRELKAFINE
jgi:septum formation protein